MNQENPAEEIQIDVRGGVALVALSRGRVLNALSLEMIRTLSAALRKWEKDPAIRAVFIKGAGGKAFCAGGDVRAFYKAGMEYRRGNVSLKVPSLYFAEEYSLNRQIFHYSKPIVAFMNGITMGGGYGIAGHCKFRVTTANTIFAMPETKIGFFADVGSTYHLARCPSSIGWYLALTGYSIGAADMIAAKLAEHYIAPENEDALVKAMIAGQDIAKTLASLGANPAPHTPVLSHIKQIEDIFGTQDVPRILEGLEKDGSDWARETLEAIHQRSPTSVMVVAEQMRRATGQTFDDIMGGDFILAQKFLQGVDMYEGIRAVIIEKDNAPRWTPADYDSLSEKAVKDYFRPTGYDLNDVQIFAA